MPFQKGNTFGKAHGGIKHPLQWQPYTLPKLKDWEWGYIAGFIEGEGCIHIEHRKDKRCNIIRFYITNTNLEILEWIQSKLQAGKIYKKKKQKESYKQPYCLQIQKIIAIFLILNRILPMLKEKRDKAETCIEELEIYMKDL